MTCVSSNQLRQRAVRDASGRDFVQALRKLGYQTTRQMVPHLDAAFARQRPEKAREEGYGVSPGIWRIALSSDSHLQKTNAEFDHLRQANSALSEKLTKAQR